jgi:DNA-binding CsgD family transcriptional regulator
MRSWSSRPRLGRQGFEAEFNAGKRLSRDAAIGTALGEPAHVVATPDGVSVAPLAKREADVARLVAEGLSNKQIGARLFISERTVDSHVRSILNKLGFNSRAQIAGWTASSNQQRAGEPSDLGKRQDRRDEAVIRTPNFAVWPRRPCCGPS